MNYYEKRYYTIYHNAEDKTFIMCDLWVNEDISYTEVVGFHFGEPDAHSFDFISKRKAAFDF